MYGSEFGAVVLVIHIFLLFLKWKVPTQFCNHIYCLIICYCIRRLILHTNTTMFPIPFHSKKLVGQLTPYLTTWLCPWCWYVDFHDQIVAVKQLNLNGLQGKHEYLVEVFMLSTLHHPHLVTLIGYCNDGDQRLLVYEYMPKGSLENHLFGNPWQVTYGNLFLSTLYWSCSCFYWIFSVFFSILNVIIYCSLRKHRVFILSGNFLS